MIAVFAAGSAPGALLAAVPLWWSIILGHPLGLAALLAVCLVVVEQLTYFIPGRIFWVLRWLLSIAILAGAAVTIIHFDPFRNGPLRSVVFSILSSVLVWSFILAVCLLRWRQPSVHDHAAKGYSDAFSCPEDYSNSNYVYNELGLTSPLCRKVTHQAYDSWLPEAIRDVNPDQKTL